MIIFRGLADRHLRGVLSISRDETASYICLRMSRCGIRSIIEQINGVLVSKIDFISTHAQKGSILAFCRGLADRHLRGVLSIPEDETAFNIRLRIATTCPWV